MNMQVGRVWTAPPAAGEGQGSAQSQRASRRLYLPAIVIAGLAAWLSWRGWTALGQTGVGRSFDDGRYQLAGPVVLGFVLTVCVLEQAFPAQRRPLLARGHLLDFCYALFYGFHLTFSSGLAWTVLTVEAAGVVMLLLTAAVLWQRR
jgi:hypothetical protein